MTLIRTVDPKTGAPKVIIYANHDGKEMLKELSPESYRLDRMSAARLDTIADLSEVSAGKFGAIGRINGVVGRELHSLNTVRPIPKTPTKRELRRQELRELVGEAGLRAAREVGARRAGAILTVKEQPRRTLRETPLPPVF